MCSVLVHVRGEQTVETLGTRVAQLLCQKRVALLVGWTSGVFLSLSFLRPGLSEYGTDTSASVCKHFFSGGFTLVILGGGVDFAYLFFLFIDCATDLVCMLVRFLRWRSI